MANIIDYHARPDLPCVKMSNSTTSVFVAVLALAASALATADRHRMLAAWIASRDQSLLGIGMVGFDVSDLPWSEKAFAEDRAFVLQAICAAKAKVGWERLGFTPLQDGYLQLALDGFHALVEAFAIEHACWDDKKVWKASKPEAWELCPTHAACKHALGCVLCNDL